MAGLHNTPNANRLHIGIYGKRNSGKSSLINAITSQDTALVSEVAGTTTDPVTKAMEVQGLGPCVFIDTAGFDDVGELGAQRIEKTKKSTDKADIAILVFSDADNQPEYEWFKLLKSKKIPVVAVINKSDILENISDLSEKIEKEFGLKPVIVSAVKRKGIDDIISEILRLMPEDFEQRSIAGHLVGDGDLVLLVMPQDIQAPKGRLILPQVQTIRDLLDNKCIVAGCTTDKLDETLAAFSKPPKLIITDSQVYKIVYDKKPPQSSITSFSMLMAAQKGDIAEFVQGANALDSLNENSTVLIAEACTHVPQTEDIGTVKIPGMLRNKFGEGIKIENTTGVNFPEDLSRYDLIIHCGACMFNKKYVMSRIEKAKADDVPITNYGVAIAKLNGILDKVCW